MVSFPVQTTLFYLILFLFELFCPNYEYPSVKLLVPPQSTIFIYMSLFIFVVVLHKLQLSLSYGVISTAINNKVLQRLVFV